MAKHPAKAASGRKSVSGLTVGGDSREGMRRLVIPVMLRCVSGSREEYWLQSVQAWPAQCLERPSQPEPEVHQGKPVKLTVKSHHVAH